VGDYLFVVTALTLFMFFWIDIFRSWYVKFLTRRGVSATTIRTMMLILWVTLTLVFWYTLLHRGMPEEFTIGHFAFALFIFSIYSLFRTVFKRQK
jgi:hypothetical protein